LILSLVKHPRSSLLLAMLYRLSYLQLQLLFKQINQYNYHEVTTILAKVTLFCQFLELLAAIMASHFNFFLSVS